MSEQCLGFLKAIFLKQHLPLFLNGVDLSVWGVEKDDLLKIIHRLVILFLRHSQVTEVEIGE